MSELSRSPTPRRRADAVRSIAAIVEAAIDVLSVRPDASMEDVAKAAGLTRPTIYAHFSSREALLKAVAQHALAQTAAAIDAAELERGEPAEALDRLITASWQTLERYPLLMALRAPMSAEEEHALHGPIFDRLQQLVKRGQHAGAFDRELPPAWLLAAFIGLSHAAAEEVRAGRISTDNAVWALKRSLSRVFGIASYPE